MDNSTLRNREMPKPGDHVFIFSNRDEWHDGHHEISKEPVECRVIEVRRHPAQSIVILQPNTLTDLQKLDKREQEAWVENGAIVRTEVGWFRTLAELNERAAILNRPRPVSLVRESDEGSL